MEIVCLFTYKLRAFVEKSQDFQVLFQWFLYKNRFLDLLGTLSRYEKVMANIHIFWLFGIIKHKYQIYFLKYSTGKIYIIIYLSQQFFVFYNYTY